MGRHASPLNTAIVGLLEQTKGKITYNKAVPLLNEQGFGLVNPPEKSPALLKWQDAMENSKRPPKKSASLRKWEAADQKHKGKMQDAGLAKELGFDDKTLKAVTKEQKAWEDYYANLMKKCEFDAAQMKAVTKEAASLRQHQKESGFFNVIKSHWKKDRRHNKGKQTVAPEPQVQPTLTVGQKPPKYKPGQKDEALLELEAIRFVEESGGMIKLQAKIKETEEKLAEMTDAVARVQAMSQRIEKLGAAA